MKEKMTEVYMLQMNRPSHTGSLQEQVGFLGRRQSLRAWQFVVLNGPLVETLWLVYWQWGVGKLTSTDVAEHKLGHSPLLTHRGRQTATHLCTTWLGQTAAALRHATWWLRSSSHCAQTTDITLHYVILPTSSGQWHHTIRYKKVF